MELTAAPAPASPHGLSPARTLLGWGGSRVWAVLAALEEGKPGWSMTTAGPGKCRHIDVECNGAAVQAGLCWPPGDIKERVRIWDVQATFHEGTEERQWRKAAVNRTTAPSSLHTGLFWGSTICQLQSCSALLLPREKCLQMARWYCQQVPQSSRAKEVLQLLGLTTLKTRARDQFPWLAVR